MKKDPNVNVTQIVAAYYYVDDVSIRLLNEDEKCDCQAEESAQEFSPIIYQKVFNLTEGMTPKDKIEIQEIFFGNTLNT